MRIIKSIAIHKRSHSEPIPPRSAVIDKAYNDIFAPENPLDMDNVNLKRLSSNWALSHSRLLRDLDLIQSQLFLEREKNAYLQHQLHQQSNFLEDLKQSLVRHEQLIATLSEIGLCDGIVAKAHLLVSNGKPAMDALVMAIREAATVPGSDWSVILAAVVGCRTQAEYTAALNLSINARRELRKFKKIAKFWKKLAVQRSPPFPDLVTPSVSALSSVYEKLSPGRRDAVNMLVNRRVQEGRSMLASELPFESITTILSRQAAPPHMSSKSFSYSKHSNASTKETSCTVLVFISIPRSCHLMLVARQTLQELLTQSHYGASRHVFYWMGRVVGFRAFHR